MIGLVFGNRERPDIRDAICDFVLERISVHGGSFGPCGGLGIVDDEKLIAGILFHNWVPDNRTIEISAAADSPKWLSRSIINTIMQICFEQHGCQMVVSRMSKNNVRAAQIYRFLKFSEIEMPRLYGRDESGLIMSLTDDAWNMHPLNNRNNHGQSTSTTRP